MEFSSDRRVLIFILFVYVAFMFYSPQNISHHRKAEWWVGVPTSFYGDGQRYYQLTREIADNGRLNVFDDVSGLKNPISLSRGVGGRVYITHSPGLSFLGVPFYILLREPGLYLLNVLLGWLTCVFIYYTCELYVTKDSAAKTTMFFGLGTMMFTYSEVFYADILSAALVSGSFYFMLRYSKLGGLRHMVYSGLLAGLMPLSKPTLVSLAFVLALYAAYKRGFKAVGFFALGFILLGWVFIAYNMVCFGMPFMTGYNTTLQSLNGELTLIDHTSSYFWSNNLMKTVPLMVLILVMTQPIVLASVVGILKEKRDENSVVAISVVILLLIYGRFFSPLGTWCWSVRYLLPALPLLALPFSFSYERELVPHYLVWALFYISLLLTILSLAPAVWHAFSGMSLVEMANLNPLIKPNMV
ncbi:MAG: glycosyltransferase family 39 protein [Candidatus Altiarchaeota archaeon]